MSSLRTFSITVALIVGTAIPASAGRRTPAPVTINTSTKTASGSLGSARKSSDNNQHIGCYAQIYPVLDPNAPPSEYSTTYYNCFAVTSTGTAAGCILPFGQHATYDVPRTLAEDSFLKFTWNDQGLCTSIEVQNYSYYEPVQS